MMMIMMGRMQEIEMSDKLNAGEESGKKLQSVWDVCHRSGGGLHRLGTQYIAVPNPMKSWAGP